MKATCEDTPRRLWLQASDKRDAGLVWLREARISYFEAIERLQECERRLIDAASSGRDVEPTLGIVRLTTEHCEKIFDLTNELMQLDIGLPKPSLPSEESYFTADMGWVE